MQCPKVFRVAAACTGDKGQELFTKKNALEKKGKRNPYKLNMFMQAREEGNVPTHITSMFDNARNHPKGERARRTEIVNALFEKNEKGGKNGWVMCANKPLFTEEKTRYPEGYRNFE